MATHQELMKAAIALGGKYGRGIAILAKPDRPITEAKIGEHVIVKPHSAAAALLHRELDDLVGWNLYLSYPPTQVCLGLSWRAKVNQVCFVDSSSEIMIRINPNAPINSGYGYDYTSESIMGIRSLRENRVLQQQFLKNLEGGLPDRMSKESDRPEIRNIAAKLSLGLMYRQPINVTTCPEVHNAFMRLVYALVRWGWNDEETNKTKRGGADQVRPYGNNIAGILVASDNKILAWGLNMKQVNPTFHAETMMIQYYLRRNNRTSLPDGCRLYTSLECCNMCAGHVAELGKDVKVYYGQKDTNIAPTALSRGINGCQQFPAPIAHVQMLDRAQFDRFTSKNQTIDFLFDKKGDKSEIVSTKSLFEHGAHLRPINLSRSPLTATEQAAAKIAREADRFLSDLQYGGILVGLSR